MAGEDRFGHGLAKPVLVLLIGGYRNSILPWRGAIADRIRAEDKITVLDQPDSGGAVIGQELDLTLLEGLSLVGHRSLRGDRADLLRSAASGRPEGDCQQEC